MESRLGSQSYVALGSGDGRWEEETVGYAGIDQVTGNASQLGKGLGTSWFELVELLFNDRGHQDPNGPVAEQLASDPMLRSGGFEAGTVTPIWSSRVHGSNTPAFERTRSDA